MSVIADATTKIVSGVRHERTRTDTMHSMSLIDSVRVLGAMARVTASTVVGALRGDLQREDVDDSARWFGHRVVDLLGVELVVKGAERVPPDRAYIYMSNHQSHLDIPMLYAALPSPTIRMLAKTELFQIPVWGRALKAAEFIEVHRGDKARARESISEAARMIRDGVSIWIAPEGTRSKTGEIGTLKKGGFHLAKDTGAPIVPVGVSGTIDILPRGGKVMQTGQRVEVTIGAPIPVEDRSVDDLAAEVRDFMISCVSR